MVTEGIRGEWQYVPACHSRTISAVTTALFQVVLYNRYEDLQMEASNHHEDDGPTKLEVPQRLSWPTVSIKTSTIMKKKTGSNNRLPSEGKKRPKIQTRPTS